MCACQPRTKTMSSDVLSAKKKTRNQQHGDLLKLFYMQLLRTSSNNLKPNSTPMRSFSISKWSKQHLKKKSIECYHRSLRKLDKLNNLSSHFSREWRIKYYRIVQLTVQSMIYSLMYTISMMIWISWRLQCRD